MGPELSGCGTSVDSPYEEASQFLLSSRSFPRLHDNDRCVLIKAEDDFDIAVMEGLIQHVNRFFRASREHSITS